MNASKNLINSIRVLTHHIFKLENNHNNYRCLYELTSGKFTKNVLGVVHIQEYLCIPEVVVVTRRTINYTSTEMWHKFKLIKIDNEFKTVLSNLFLSTITISERIQDVTRP